VRAINFEIIIIDLFANYYSKQVRVVSGRGDAVVVDPVCNHTHNTHFVLINKQTLNTTTKTIGSRCSVTLTLK